MQYCRQEAKVNQELVLNSVSYLFTSEVEVEN